MIKKNFLSLCGMLALSSVSAQFNINIKTDASLAGKEVYIYTLNGSKDILFKKEKLTSSGLNVKYPSSYQGMMKAYFPDFNYALNFISENKNVDFVVNSNNGRIDKVVYNDTANKLMNDIQDRSKKKEYILPALLQIKEFYQADNSFFKALNAEIASLEGNNTVDYTSHPFIDFYTKNSNDFVSDKSNQSEDNIIQFLNNSSPLLESSSLMRPILLSFLGQSQNREVSIDKLLNVVNLESSRGQNILSELLEIFDIYSMKDLKTKYLNQATSLKCTINDRLSNTIALSQSLEIGGKFSDVNLDNAINSNLKKLSDIKSKKKVIIFWSSGCSHCDNELPKLIPYYENLRKNNIEVIGFSLDSDKMSYSNKAKNFPWVSASELKGWYSSYVEKYNVHATPYYFILDENNKIESKPDRVNDVISQLNLK